MRIVASIEGADVDACAGLYVDAGSGGASARGGTAQTRPDWAAADVAFVVEE